jgi:hypothetical protein
LFSFTLIPGIFSIGINFAFIYMCTHFLHHIHSLTTFPHHLSSATDTTPQQDLFCIPLIL